MSQAMTCPRCGSPLPEDAPRKLCPACLFEAALASESCSLAGEEPAGVAGSHPPDDPAATRPMAEGGVSVETIAPETMGPITDGRRSNIAETVIGSTEGDILCILGGEEPAGVSGSHPTDDPAATRRPDEGRRRQ